MEAIRSVVLNNRLLRPTRPGLAKVEECRCKRRRTNQVAAIGRAFVLFFRRLRLLLFRRLFFSLFSLFFFFGFWLLFRFEGEKLSSDRSDGRCRWGWEGGGAFFRPSPLHQNHQRLPSLPTVHHRSR